MVAYARSRAQFARRDIVGDPVEVIRRQLAGEERVVSAQHHAVFCRVDALDIQRCVRGDAEALALADGVVHDALVPAEHTAAFIDKVARGAVAARVARDKASVVAVRHKADILTVRLVRVVEALLLRDAARLALVHRAERQTRVRELLLRERIEHVTLVLALIERLFEKPPPVFLFDARVMARDDGVAAKNAGALVETLEFQIAVAVDAGVRRRTVLVGGDKAVDDLTLEVIREVEDIVGNAETECDRARILHILERAAGLRGLHANILVLKEFHRCADALAALVLHQKCGDARVHTAAHCDQYLIHISHTMRHAFVGDTAFTFIK